MPAPTASQLEGLATSAVQNAGIEGENANDLAKAMAATVADALNQFVSMGMVLPGIPAAAPPPPGSGSTAGPGMLAPPPAGGPHASAIEGIASGHVQANGLQGEDANKIAAFMGQAMELALMQFTSQVQVAPGIAIAGFTTTSPGSLI
jgi:hypothetical protein